MWEGWVERDPVKVSGIVEWPVPWNKKEAQDTGLMKQGSENL